jgi:hypothetical protein
VVDSYRNQGAFAGVLLCLSSLGFGHLVALVALVMHIWVIHLMKLQDGMESMTLMNPPS